MRNHRRFKFLLSIALPIALLALALAIAQVDDHLDRAKQQHEKDRVSAMLRGRAICIGVLGQARLSGGIAATSFEDCLEKQIISLEDYVFLTNQGAIFHASAWNSPDSNAVVMELLNGDYLISRNGAGWKKSWKRILRETQKNDA